MKKRFLALALALTLVIATLTPNQTAVASEGRTVTIADLGFQLLGGPAATNVLSTSTEYAADWHNQLEWGANFRDIKTLYCGAAPVKVSMGEIETTIYYSSSFTTSPVGQPATLVDSYTLNEPGIYLIDADGCNWYVVVGSDGSAGTGSTDTADTADTTNDAAVTLTNFVAMVNVNVRSEAKVSSDVIGGYKKGSPIVVIEQANRLWYKVQYNDNKIGYVSSLFVTGFDSAFYAAQNPDVVRILGSTFDDLYGHYVRHGKEEGRAPYAR